MKVISYYLIIYGNNATGLTVCRSAVDVCDVTEMCTGTSASCPSNSLAGSEDIFD